MIKRKKIILSILLGIVFAGLLLFANSSAYAANANCKLDGNLQNSDELCNPLPDNDLVSVVVTILKWVMGVIAGLAVVMIVYAGFMMVISSGNEKAVESSKNQIKWALIGLTVAILAYSFVAILQGALGIGS